MNLNDLVDWNCRGNQAAAKYSETMKNTTTAQSITLIRRGTPSECCVIFQGSVANWPRKAIEDLISGILRWENSGWSHAFTDNLEFEGDFQKSEVSPKYGSVDNTNELWQEAIEAVIKAERYS